MDNKSSPNIPLFIAILVGGHILPGKSAFSSVLSPDQTTGLD
jgi:hypothetical protein